MSDEPKVEDLEAVEAELETAAYNSIAHILSYLANFYGGHFEDDFDLNRQFLKILARMMGDMLGHFPEDQREELINWAFKEVQYVMDMTSTDLALENNLDESGEKISTEEFVEKLNKRADEYDLTTMKPQGSC